MHRHQWYQRRFAPLTKNPMTQIKNAITATIQRKWALLTFPWAP